MNKINITMGERKALIEEIHANAVAKGFWSEDHSEDHSKMLVITELSEAVEADRKGRRADRSAYEDALKLCTPAVTHSPAHFECFIKDTVEDELADAVIRIYDMIGAYGYSIQDNVIKSICKDVLFVLEEYHISGFPDYILLCVEALIDSGVVMAIAKIEAVAEHNGIDLYWHVREKMKYNAGRPPLHGKKY